MSLSMRVRACPLNWTAYHCSAFRYSLNPAYGRDVKTAFELGRNQIDLQGLGEEDTPRLLAPHADPSQVVLARQ
jgi:hypothetical protein